jgi:NO-binding membrane sensor protein with MHYT domain
MTYVEAILKVLVVGLLLGAGLPALFATGMVAFSNGAGGEHSDGTVTAPNPILKTWASCSLRWSPW